MIMTTRTGVNRKFTEKSRRVKGQEDKGTQDED